MADPRNSVAFDEIGAKRATFKIDNSTILYDATKVGGSSQVGLAVTLTGQSDDTVALCSDGDEVKGRLDLVESDNKCTVQINGGMKLPAGTGASLSKGKKIVGAQRTAAKGYIREVATGTAAELGKARGEIINAADTDNVVVML